MALSDELSTLSIEDRKILRAGFSGEKVDLESLKNAANKLSTGSLKELSSSMRQRMTAEDDKRALQEMFEAQTLTGQLKKAGRSALESAIEVGEFIDKYTGAPTRAAIEKLQEGEFTGSLKAFGEQFGEDPALAPTGKEIAVKAGLSPKESIDLPVFGKVSPAGIAGLGIDITADPTNIIPLGAAAKLGTRAIGKTAKGTLSLAKKGIAKGSAAAIRSARAKSPYFDEVSKAISLKFKPQRAPDFGELVDIAKKNKIDPEVLPEAVEFGKESVITRAMRKKGEGVLGEPILRRHENAIKEVNNAIVNNLEDVSGGRILTPEEAGQVIREGYQRSIEDFFKQIDTTYATIGERAGPGFRLDPKAQAKLNSVLEATEESANKLVNSIDPIKQKQAKITLDAVEKLRASDGNYVQLVEDLQDIGSVGFNRQAIVGIVPPDVRAMRKLYHDVQKPMIDTIREQLGPQIADDLLENNKLMSEFLSDRNIVSKAVLNDRLADEQVFKVLVSNADTKKIDALLGMLRPEEVSQLKGAFFDSLIKRDIEGQFTFRSLFNRLQNKQAIAERLFEPEEMDNLLDLTRLGDRLGLPILSTSGTGAAESFKNIPEAVGRGFGNDAIIDSLKRMARGQKVEKVVPKGTPISLRRGRVERALKAAQVGSVQERNPDTPLNNALRR
jgi:hypothetical protein